MNWQSIEILFCSPAASVLYRITHSVGVPLVLVKNGFLLFQSYRALPNFLTNLFYCFSPFNADLI